MISSARRQALGIERLYLDFDSFFASAEQHFNPSLRNCPVGVVSIDSPYSSCIALSREAKALGLKTGVTIKDARQIIPNMVFVVARHDVYVRLHNRIVQVIDTCLPVENVRSIDEVVCHLRRSEAEKGTALAHEIKQALALNFSNILTCSIGMASTELLAKIAAEMNKPDGITVLDMVDLPHRLNHLSLKDLPGVSTGIETRLQAAGIGNVEALWHLAPKHARAIWKSVEGERFWNELHGYHVERPKTAKCMFGHSRMLPGNWRNPEKIRICARLLTMSAGRRLRRTNLRASRLSLTLRGSRDRRKKQRHNKSMRWQWETHFPPARDDHTFLKALSEGLAECEKELNFKPRSVSVTIFDLVDNQSITEDLFNFTENDTGQGLFQTCRQKWECVSEVMDHLRSVHGPEAISIGPRSEVPGGYLGAKIAFGRIPDQSEFSEAPIPDHATHFCST